MDVLVVDSLTKIYPGDVVAVDNISFKVGKGVYSIMGPNGSGKTTTLNMCSGVLKPTSGKIYIYGIDVWGSDWMEARRKIGYAPQDMPFVTRVSALDNLIWIGMLKDMSISEARKRAKELLEALDLYEHRNLLVSKYSGGMRRRLIIAAALMHNPEVIFLDEPGSGLDPKAKEEVWMYIENIREDRTVVFTTHDAHEAERFSVKTFIFHKGRIIAEGIPQELIREYAPNPVVSVWFKEGVKPPTINGVEPEVVGSIGRYDSSKVSFEDVVSYLRKEGIPFSRIEILEPSLNEVFLRLTGEMLEVG